MPDKYYRPKGNLGGNPIFNPRDIVYIRFVQGEKVVRVTKYDPYKDSIVFALYSTENPNEFSGEAFHNVDDNSPRRVIEKSELQDKIWVALLEGISPLEILKGHKPKMIGAGPGDSYKYEEGKESRTFHIIESEEPKSTSVVA